MARTNIELDDRLVREGLKVFKCRSKRELVHLALTELLKGAKRKEILKLRGLEREHIHLTLLEEAIRGIEDLDAGKLLTPAKLRARHSR